MHCSQIPAPAAIAAKSAALSHKKFSPELQFEQKLNKERT